MHQLRYLDDPLLEDPEGVRDGQHDPGDRMIEGVFQGGEIDHPLSVGGDLRHGEPGGRRRCRVRPVRRIGEEDPPALSLSPLLEVTLDDEHPGQLAVGARGRLEGDGGETGDPGEEPAQLVDEAERPLRQLRIGEGMKAGEPGEAGEVLVDLRVVLHRAASERVHPVIDPVVRPSEAGVVPGEGRLAQLRYPSRYRAEEPLPEEAGGPFLRDVE